MRQYLTEMREEAYIDLKPGYTDTGASAKETKPVYSAYTPPQPKKKKKVERTRFRETAHSFRQKSGQTADATPATPVATKKDASLTTQKPGKKEKIRFGKAPTKTLPTAASSTTEDAGAEPAPAVEPANPLEATKPTEKSRFSARATTHKKTKAAGSATDSDAPAPPDAAEVADRQSQAAPLGLSGDTSKKKKKKTPTTTGDKTRLADKNKKPDAAPGDSGTTPAPAPQAPAPAPQAPAPAPQAPAPAPQQ